MGQPIPPGDIPLYEGLGTEWNEFVGAFPEEKRAELAPKLKARIDAYEPLKQYEDFQKSGVAPDQISTALNLFSVIENNPRQVYDAIGKHLGITTQEAKEVVQELKETTESHPEIATLRQQVEVMSQILLAQRQQSSQEEAAAAQEALLDKEMNDLKNKYGSDVDEDEILMRMAQKNLTAEQAYQDYAAKVSTIRQRRPAPMVMGSNSGVIPQRAIDPTKLSNADTKNLVAQMMQHAATENKL